MLVLYALPVVLMMVSPMATPFLIMFGVAGPGLGAAYLYRKIFSKLEPEQDGITSDMDFKVDMEGVETEEVSAENAIDAESEDVTDDESADE